MSNIVIVAGQPLDIDSLPLQGQLELIKVFNSLKSKFQREVPIETVPQEKVLSLEELFKTVKGKLPPDYKFDREEANAR